MLSFYNYLVICLTIQLLSLLVPSNSQLSTKANVIVNILDDNGLRGALWFIDSIKLYNKLCLGDIYIFMHENIVEQYNSNSSSYSDISIKHFIYKNNGPIPYVGIGRPNPKPEHVSDILESWSIVQDLYSTNNKPNGLFLSISFESNYLPVATPNFLHLFERLGDNTTDNYGLILLGKVRRLTSVSDWHDISLAVFDYNNKGFIKWLNTFKRVYFAHTLGRKAFNLLEPRPALLEANSQHIHDLSIGYFDSSEICSTTADWSRSYSPEIISKIKGLNLTSNLCHVGHVMNHTNSHGLQEDILNINHKHRSHIYGESRCHHLSVYRADSLSNYDSISLLTAIEIYCGSSQNNNECLILDLPNYWMKKISRSVPEDITQVARRSKDVVDENIMHLMWNGVLRFKNTSSFDVPRKFCWETGSKDFEELSKSRIEYNLSHSIPFPHSDHKKFASSTSNVSVVIMTGTVGSGEALTNKMYLSLSKMYYAKRHGYRYVTTTSNEFSEYFHKDTFKLLISEVSKSDYFHGIMSKPVMMLHVMYTNLDKEWLLWTDDDLYINPGFLYMPIDVFLSDVPSHKVYVAANYRSAFTNVFFIRNNEQGRRLVRDWIAILMSGHIQCHGFDQAAIGVLIAQRFSGDKNFTSPRPFNFTCLYSETGKLGCNAKLDWSCDFKFERALYRAGFKSPVAHVFIGRKISSYTKGCANDYVEDFHIITESPSRPRLQCGHCARLSEIESAGHWDGPLGGGNSKLIRGSLNGWFFNHKAEFLFYESYINPNACIKVENFIPNCNEHTVLDSDRLFVRHVISLIDGYAFDIDNGEYCRVVNDYIIKHQIEKTYMKDYKEIIQKVNKIDENEWKNRYQSYSGGEGRAPCNNSNIDCPNGAEEDGQRRRRKPLGQDDDSTYFEHNDFCSVCHEVPIDTTIQLYSIINKALDCRSNDQINYEIKNNINLD